MKRYQECNKLVKLWRLRYYLSIPFLWLYHTLIKGFSVIDTTTLETSNPRGKLLWELLVGDAQLKMRYTFTTEEIFERLKKR